MARDKFQGSMASPCLDANVLTAYFDLAHGPEETARMFAHIDACSRCRRLFEALALARTQADGPAEPGAPPVHGPLIGRYRIERMIGMGGMGVVYAAYDPELDRKVAIKLLRPSARVDASQLRARLTREAQAMARLSHPNVIHVHEIGAFAGEVFVVMELIDGTTLTAWLGERPRTWREIVAAFVAAGEGLAAAHGHGVVHRDFKPDNVLVARSGRICVTDFGLARVDRPDGGTSGGDLMATFSGRLAGTPAYMSPEQARGATTDARTDIFSFCVALYEALYHTRPYTGASLEELRKSMVDGRPAPPRRPLGPASLRRVIERGLRAEPAERPATMDELLAELRVDPVARRNRRLLAALGIAVAAGGGFAIVQQQRHAGMCRGAEARLAGIWDAARKQALRRAFAATGVPFADPVWNSVEATIDRFAADWVAMSTEACEATRLAGTQSETLLDERMRCLENRRLELAAQLDLFDKADARLVSAAPRAAASLTEIALCGNGEAVAAEFEPPPQAQRADVDRLTGRMAQLKALANSSRLSDERAAIPDVLAAAESTGYLPAEAFARYLEGSLLVAEGKLDDGIAALQRVVPVAERAHADRYIAGAWQMVAYADLIAGRDADGILWADSAAAVAVRLKTRVPLEIGGLRCVMLARLGRDDEVEEELRRGLPLVDRELDEAEAQPVRDMYAQALYFLGRYEEALPLFQRDLDVVERLYGQEHRFTRASVNNLADALVRAERCGEALALLEPLVELDRRIASPPSLAIALTTLGAAEEGAGRLPQARAHLREAIAIFEANAMGGAQLLDGLEHLGQVELAMKAPEARATLERAVAVGQAAKLGALVLAASRFGLAQALPAGERGRARQLASDARDALAAARSHDPALAHRRREIDAWLAAN